MLLRWRIPTQRASGRSIGVRRGLTLALITGLAVLLLAACEVEHRTVPEAALAEASAAESGQQPAPREPALPPTVSMPLDPPLRAPTASPARVPTAAPAPAPIPVSSPALTAVPTRTVAPAPASTPSPVVILQPVTPTPVVPNLEECWAALPALQASGARPRSAFANRHMFHLESGFRPRGDGRFDAVDRRRHHDDGKQRRRGIQRSGLAFVGRCEESRRVAVVQGRHIQI